MRSVNKLYGKIIHPYLFVVKYLKVKTPSRTLLPAGVKIGLIVLCWIISVRCAVRTDVTLIRNSHNHPTMCISHSFSSTSSLSLSFPYSLLSILFPLKRAPKPDINVEPGNLVVRVLINVLICLTLHVRYGNLLIWF